MRLLLEPIPAELIPHVLQRFDRPARGIRQAQPGLNRGHVYDRGDVARRITDGGIGTDRSACGEYFSRATYGILSVRGRGRVAVTEQPVCCELDQRIGQLRGTRGVGSDPAAQPLHQRGQCLATLSVRILRLLSCLRLGHHAFRCRTSAAALDETGQSRP